MLNTNHNSTHHDMLVSESRRQVIAGTEWNYRVDGGGRKTLLALPGAVAGGTLGPRLGRLLRGDFRIITPIYPAVSNIETMITGLAELLDAEDAERVALLGGSFGGLLAQCFVRSYPPRISHLILAGSGVPDPERAMRNRRFVRLLPLFPMSLVRWLLRLAGRALARQARQARRSSAASVFDLQSFRRDIDRLTRDDLRARYQLAIDFDSGQSFVANELDPDLPILLLDGAEDRVARNQHPKLRALYPQALSHQLAGAGHTAPLTCAAEWNHLVAEFLVTSQPNKGVP